CRAHAGKPNRPTEQIQAEGGSPAPWPPAAVSHNNSGRHDCQMPGGSMGILGTLLSVVLIAVVLGDAFEAMVLPRRVTHRYRLARLFYRGSWMLWRLLARWLPSGRRRATWLSLFGPLSLLCLFAT